jgi:hypothetical protein
VRRSPRRTRLARRSPRQMSRSAPREWQLAGMGENPALSIHIIFPGEKPGSIPLPHQPKIVDKALDLHGVLAATVQHPGLRGGQEVDDRLDWHRASPAFARASSSRPRCARHLTRNSTIGPPRSALLSLRAKRSNLDTGDSATTRLPRRLAAPRNDKGGIRVSSRGVGRRAGVELRMTTFLNGINNIPHAEERPRGASRSTHSIAAAELPPLRRTYREPICRDPSP